jgi:hypothetical protein
MSTPFQLQVPITALRWFTDSPDAGDPACLCSWCSAPIGEAQVPIRLYRELTPTDVREARFHDACCQPVFGITVSSFIPTELDDVPFDE